MSDNERERNPWAPPTAALAEPGESVSRRLGWKAYFWGMLLLFVLTYLMLGVGWMQALDVIDSMVTTIALVGMFGFAYRRRIAERRFWKLWLPAEIVWDLSVAFLLIPAGLLYQFPGEVQSDVSGWEDIAGLLILIPLYAALYRYGNRSPEIWGQS